MKILAIPLIVVALVCSLGFGFYLGQSGKLKETENKTWTCPMHPQIQEPEFGPCPICGMDLVVMETDAGLGPRQLRMSEADKKLAEIETALVERKFVETEVRMFGMVDYDETRVRTISAWVPGRLDRLYVDFTGTSVRKGDHLVLLYSPVMLTAQEELLEQKRQVEAAKDGGSEYLRESSKRALDSARDKLRLWGLTGEQIQEIERRGKAEDHVVITSPTTGIVIHKALNQGEYVTEGTPIYKIAEFDQLWLQLDAYESDIAWLRYGQEAEIVTEAFPGVTFHGWISFISPELDRKTRTVKVRVNVDNKDGKLKPGMFLRAIVRSNIALGGKVMAPKLAGKWICPMHPEVVEDEQKPCEICEMKLVRAEELYVVAEADEEKPLVVPVSAVLWTGKRSVVYVEVPGKSKPTYEGREVVLGARARDYYLVTSGLEEGESVVVKGNFKIDSALQIKAKPSMMSAKAAASRPAARPVVKKTPLEKAMLGKVRPALEPVYVAYLEIQEALAGDQFDRAKTGFGKLGEAVTAVDMKLFEGESHMEWMQHAKALTASAQAGFAAKDIEEARVSFEKNSMSVLALIARFGQVAAKVRYELFCPMAFDNRGGYWLQSTDEVKNPYYGSMMLGCGEVKRTFKAGEER